MKLILLFVMSVTATFGQGFKVLTCTKDVTIGTTPVVAGMVIDYSNDRLNVPEGGRVGVLTDDGYVGNVTKTVMSRSVPTAITAKVPIISGAVPRGAPPDISFPGAAKNDKAFMIGDSLFVFWSYYREPRRKATHLVFVDMFDDELSRWKITGEPWMLLNITQIRGKETYVSYEMRDQENKRMSGESRVIKIKENPDEARKKLEEDLVSFQNDPDKIFYDFAIYALHDLYHDRSMLLYRIVTKKLTASDPFLQAYMKRMIAEYKL